MQSSSGRLGFRPSSAFWLLALEVAVISRGAHTFELWRTAATQSTLTTAVILKDKGFPGCFCSFEGYCVPHGGRQAARSKLLYLVMPQLRAGKMLTEWQVATQTPPLQPRDTSLGWPGARASPLGTVTSYQDSGV